MTAREPSLPFLTLPPSYPSHANALGARSNIGATSHRPEAVAHAADISSLSRVMEELESLESRLLSAGSAVNNDTISLRASLKKLATKPEVTEIMERLEFKGEPVWGLSERERAVVERIREKMNEATA